MNISDVFSLAFRTVRGNKLRTGITVAIIAFGIMALVGIITAIKAMNQKLTESFSTMGANGFVIRYKERNIRFGGHGPSMKLSKKGKKKEKTSNLDKRIQEEEADQFAKYYKFPGSVGISCIAGRNFTVFFETKKTTPNVFLFGADENYLDLNGFAMKAGRNFSRQEIQSASNVCLLGYDVATNLFRLGAETAVNKIIRVNNIPYRVIGVLGSRGSSFGFSRDNILITGYKNVRRYFGTNSYTIGLMNIMLVSVAERTKEVGLIKAIGGKSKSVRQQFLLESIIISVLGAIIGIILGIIVGNLFSIVLNTGFVVPWRWVIYGVVICSIVGLLAGLYPALKAGKLNPIDALRYE